MKPLRRRMKRPPNMVTGLIFGSFDGLHEGHKHLLTFAKAHCDQLIISLAKDEHIQTLKGHAPMLPFDDRKAALRTFIQDLVIRPSDDKLGSFNIIDAVQPDMIFIGYDQMALKDAIEEWLPHTKQHIEIVQAESLQPDIYKSSLLNTYD